MKIMKLVCSVLIVGGIFWSCDFPYQPKKFETSGPSVTIDSIVGLFPITPGAQICNPSISQDIVNYPGCMLWLNFGGKQVVKIDSSKYIADFDQNVSLVQHDHLIISDTANVVRWAYTKPAHIVELQDPEWTTDRDYIIFLGKNLSNTWDTYVIRISDKQVLRICKSGSNGMDGQSTPHLWIDRTGAYTVDSAVATADTSFIPRDSIISFFGTANVKVVFNKTIRAIQNLYYIDYTKKYPVRVALNRPVATDRANWSAESPLISPDGQWITFNMTPDFNTAVSSYIQKLSSSSLPVLISDNAGQPHWWKNPNTDVLYIIYETNLALFVNENLAAVTDGSAGLTMKQRIEGDSDGPAHMLYEPVGEPVLLASWPFSGGLSPDGRFLCTGYSSAFIYKLPSF